MMLPNAPIQHPSHHCTILHTCIPNAAAPRVHHRQDTYFSLRHLRKDCRHDQEHRARRINGLMHTMIVIANVRPILLAAWPRRQRTHALRSRALALCLFDKASYLEIGKDKY